VNKAENERRLTADKRITSEFGDVKLFVISEEPHLTDSQYPVLQRHEITLANVVSTRTAKRNPPIREGDYMPAANTYSHHTLNDYRISGGSVYENSSNSKVIAAVVVIALFLGIGAYFYYSTPRYVPAPQATEDTTQSPAATPGAPDGSAPADTMQSTAPADAPAPAAPPASAPAASTQGAVSHDSMNRTAPTSKTDTQHAETKQANKAVAKPSSEAATATPDLSTSTPEAAAPTASSGEAVPSSVDKPEASAGVLPGTTGEAGG